MIGLIDLMRIASQQERKLIKEVESYLNEVIPRNPQFSRPKHIIIDKSSDIIASAMIYWRTDDPARMIQFWDLGIGNRFEEISIFDKKFAIIEECIHATGYDHHSLKFYDSIAGFYNKTYNERLYFNFFSKLYMMFLAILHTINIKTCQIINIISNIILLPFLMILNSILKNLDKNTIYENK